MFDIEIKFFDEWAKLACGYESRNDAEWDIGFWKSKVGITDDTIFRVVEVPSQVKELLVSSD